MMVEEYTTEDFMKAIREEALEEGREEGREEIAKNMKDMGFSVEQILSLTGVDVGSRL